MTGRICRTGVCGGLVTAHSRATGNLTLPPARIQLQKPVGFLVEKKAETDKNKSN